MLNEMLWHEFETYLPSNCIVHHAAVTEGRTIHDVVQHLITLLPEKFSLIGFSMGGYIARQLAAEFPERVESLVLIASSLREDTPLEAEAKRKSVQSLSPTTFKGLSRHAIARSLHPLNTSNLKWFTEFGHLNRGDMLTSEQHRCHNEKKKFQRRV